MPLQQYICVYNVMEVSVVVDLFFFPLVKKIRTYLPVDVMSFY
jgi:hypothetical protein